MMKPVLFEIEINFVKCQQISGTCQWDSERVHCMKDAEL